MGERNDRPGRPRNVVVVGSGRSGTSLVAGLIATAGHHMGRHLVRPNEANPKGFFEDYRTLLINEELLAPHTRELPKPRFTDQKPYPEPLRDLQRWLAVLGPETLVEAPPELLPKMRSSLEREPWCRKDPRFCHTLPAWEPLFGDALRVCVFREPSRTANSMRVVARTQGVELSFEGGLEIWAGAYQQVLTRHRHHGQWLFVHYDQILDRTALPGLEREIGASLDPGMVDQALRRAPASGGWPAAVDEVYRELCGLAGYRPDRH